MADPQRKYIRRNTSRRFGVRFDRLLEIQSAGYAGGQHSETHSCGHEGKW
jgi:hypothetical protein